MKYNPDETICELHGFFDASEQAYAAVISIRALIKKWWDID